MKIDYSQHSLEDLQWVLRSIDKDKNPGNYEALIQAISIKEAEPKPPKPWPPRVAGFWRRLSGILLDYALIFLVFIPFYLMAKDSRVGSGFLFLILSPLVMLYPVYFHARFGATLGKIIMGIRVVTTDYKAISLRAAVKRSIVDLCLGAALIALGAYHVFSAADGAAVSAAMKKDAVVKGFQVLQNIWLFSEALTCLFNKRRRALHDFIAGTVVVIDDH